MKTKMKDNQMPEILALFVVFIIILWFNLFLFSLSEPHFKITEEVCEEKKIHLGEKLVEVETTTCNITAQQTGRERHCIKSLPPDYKCEERVCKYLIVEIRNEPYIETFEVWEDIYENQTTCEQVEVEIIEYPTDKIVCAGIYEVGKERRCGNYTTFLFKDDMTIEWLDENAECEDWENKARTDWNFCGAGKSYYEPSCGEKCSKYKLGNYTIETWEQMK